MKRAALAAVAIVALAVGVHAWRAHRPAGQREAGTSGVAGASPARPAPDPGGLPLVFTSNRDRFSIRYPAGYTADSTYAYQGLGAGAGIRGVRFEIDPALAGGTNLSPDSYLSVETLAPGGSCDAGRFLEAGAEARAVSRDTVLQGVRYSFAGSIGAAAGNRYEEDVFALTGTNPCIAIRYFIHYAAIENYPPGTVREFDRPGILHTFDAIRSTLVTAPAHPEAGGKSRSSDGSR